MIEFYIYISKNILEMHVYSSLFLLRKKYLVRGEARMK